MSEYLSKAVCAPCGHALQTIPEYEALVPTSEMMLITDCIVAKCGVCHEKFAITWDLVDDGSPIPVGEPLVNKSLPVEIVLPSLV